MADTQEEIDRLAVDVMVDGGRYTCDNAIDKWWRGAYLTDQKTINENIDKWKRVRSAIADMRAILRAPVKR